MVEQSTRSTATPDTFRKASLAEQGRNGRFKYPWRGSRDNKTQVRVLESGQPETGGQGKTLAKANSNIAKIIHRFMWGKKV